MSQLDKAHSQDQGFDRMSKPGWLHLDGGFVPISEDHLGRGHTAAIMRDPGRLGFRDVRDVAETAGERFLQHLDELRVLTELLDGNSEVWQALYRRGWLRLTYDGKCDTHGLVVEQPTHARRAAKHLVERHGCTKLTVDLYDWAQDHCFETYEMDSEQIDLFLQYGRLADAWRTWRKGAQVPVRR